MGKKAMFICKKNKIKPTEFTIVCDDELFFERIKH